MTTILVVDDDRKLTDMLQRTLLYEGFQVVTATDGRTALDQAQAHHPDLIVLDWLLPGLDGLAVLRHLRERDAPLVLMLTARDAVEDRVLGLDSGADDYLVKPFAPSELLARIRALLRRSEATGKARPLAFGELHLDPATRSVQRGQRPIRLTRKEFDLLQQLMLHARQVLPRERLIEAVWGFDYGGSGNVLEVYVGYLRTKTEAAGEPRLIQTVRGVGYVLREE